MALSPDRKRVAADLVAMLARAGVTAEVVPPSGLNDFLRRQAAQLLDAAESCRCPELRAEMEQMARATLAELDRLKRQEH
jgi:hypothetical protein